MSELEPGHQFGSCSRKRFLTRNMNRNRALAGLNGCDIYDMVPKIRIRVELK